MKITWTIDKKRGNYRPTLKYTITLEEHECAIATASLQIESTIPCIPRPSRAWCMEGEDERAEGWQPEEFHRLTVPWFRVGSDSGFFRLPFRTSGEYPEVEESFRLLRERYEEVVRKTYSWRPIHESGELETSKETKEAVAARLAAMRMLSFQGAASGADGKAAPSFP